MVEKGVLAQELIKQQRCLPKGVPEEKILCRMQNNQVGDVDAVQGLIIGKIYHIIATKYPDYVMLMMKTYGMLENLEGSDTQQKYKGVCGQLATKIFNYHEV